MPSSSSTAVTAWAPGRRGRPCGLQGRPSTSPIGPSAISGRSRARRPLGEAGTSSTSCSTSRMANPGRPARTGAWRRGRRSRRGRGRRTARPAAASGRVISARPTSTRRPGRGSGARSARRPGRRGRASPAPRRTPSSSARGRPRPRRSRHRRPSPGGPRSAISRCSRTVDSGNSSIRWNDRPIPRGPGRGRPAGGVLAVEADGAPVGPQHARRTQLKNVVLPAPLGPMRPTRSPASTRSDTRRGHDPGEGAGDPLGLQDRRAHHVVPDRRLLGRGAGAPSS